MVISKFKEQYRNQGKCITELEHGSKLKGTNVKVRNTSTDPNQNSTKV